MEVVDCLFIHCRWSLLSCSDWGTPATAGSDVITHTYRAHTQSSGETEGAASHHENCRSVTSHSWIGPPVTVPETDCVLLRIILQPFFPLLLCFSRSVNKHGLSLLPCLCPSYFEVPSVLSSCALPPVITSCALPVFDCPTRVSFLPGVFYRCVFPLPSCSCLCVFFFVPHELNKSFHLSGTLVSRVSVCILAPV